MARTPLKPSIGKLAGVDARRLMPLTNNEIEVSIFVKALKRSYPSMTAGEARKYIARIKAVRVTDSWIYNQWHDLEIEPLLLGVSEDEQLTLAATADRDVAKVTEAAMLDVQRVSTDSVEMAKTIKSKMMSEVDDRLESDPDNFTIDELIRGAKTFHEIEHNIGDDSPRNININIEQFNAVYGNLKERATTDGQGERPPILDGEVSGA